MNREHCFNQSLCEKGQVWRGGEKLPFSLNLKWQNNKRCSRRGGESCSCAGPASPCHSPNKSVRNWLLHFSVDRRQVLATSPSKDWMMLLEVSDFVNSYSHCSHLPFTDRCPRLNFISLVTPEELLLWLNSCVPSCITTEISTPCLQVIVQKPVTGCSCRVLCTHKHWNKLMEYLQHYNKVLLKCMCVYYSLHSFPKKFSDAVNGYKCKFEPLEFHSCD